MWILGLKGLIRGRQMTHEVKKVSGVLFSFDHRLERKCLDLLSHSLNKFLIKEMYRNQFGEFVCGYNPKV